MPKGPSRSDAPRDWVRASEVGQYSFCARAWWYQHVQGVPPDDVRPLRVGEAAHRQHGVRVQAAVAMRWVALLLLGLALVALLVALGGG